MDERERIAEIVAEHLGMKAMTLAIYGVDMGVAYDMAEKGELVEVEYVLPSMPYRVKSFFLPKGTEVQLKK